MRAIFSSIIISATWSGVRGGLAPRYKFQKPAMVLKLFSGLPYAFWRAPFTMFVGFGKTDSAVGAICVHIRFTHGISFSLKINNILEHLLSFYNNYNTFWNKTQIWAQQIVPKKAITNSYSQIVNSQITIIHIFPVPPIVRSKLRWHFHLPPL